MPYGIQDHPCAANSRWRKYTFVGNDSPQRSGSGLSGVLQIQGSGPYISRLDNHPRTIVPNLKFDNAKYKDYTFDPKVEYEICEITPGVEGILSIRLNDESCQNIRNPIVNFTNHDDLPTYIIKIPASSKNLPPIEQWTNGDEFILTSSLQHKSCEHVPRLSRFGDPPVFGELSDGTWLQFDPRLQL